MTTQNRMATGLLFSSLVLTSTVSPALAFSSSGLGSATAGAELIARGGGGGAWAGCARGGVRKQVLQRTWRALAEHSSTRTRTRTRNHRDRAGENNTGDGTNAEVGITQSTGFGVHSTEGHGEGRTRNHVGKRSPGDIERAHVRNEHAGKDWCANSESNGSQ